MTLRLAARWARTVPRTELTHEWVLVVEGLLAGAVDDEHASDPSLRAATETQAEEAPAAGGVAAAEAVVATAVAGEELQELIAGDSAARLPIMRSH